MTKDLSCPCKSGKNYATCCMPYHKGQIPQHAVDLMRSRYSAYALGKVDYIIETTHPSNPHYRQNLKEWKKELIAFSQEFNFENLEILAHRESDAEATVIFVATLTQKKNDCTFTERSRFQKLKKRWLYHSGDVFSGRKTDLNA